MKVRKMSAATIKRELNARIDELLNEYNSADMVAQLIGEIRAFAATIGMTKGEAIKKFREENRQ